MRRLLLLLVLAAALVCPATACQTDDYCAAPDACHASGVRDGTGKCSNPALPDGSKCNDNDACTSGDACTQGVCGGAPVVCPATACQTPTRCDQVNGCGAPTDLPEGSACDDKSLCTTNDHCVSGDCQGTVVVHCSGIAADSCHLPEACDPNAGVCVSTAMGGPCNPNLLASPTVGCSYNVYGAQVNVGNSNLNLLLDTGSTTLAAANANCTSCTGVTPRYAPSNANTYLGGSPSSTYLDGTSWQGRVYSDHVTPLGESATVTMRFAAINAQNGFFRDYGCTLGANTPNSYQGIIGLGRIGNAVSGTDGYMAKAGSLLPANAFSILMCNPNGLMWWGGYDPVPLTGAPGFTPLLASSQYFLVQMADMSVGARSVATALTNVVVDTGTSLFLLPDDAVTALANQVGTNPTFINNFGSSSDPNGSALDFFTSGACASAAAGATPGDLDAALPTLKMTFPNAHGGFTVSLKATDSYIQPMAVAASQGGGIGYCSGVASTSHGIVILGASGMIGNVFIYDVGGGQLGIAPTSACAGM